MIKFFYVLMTTAVSQYQEIDIKLDLSQIQMTKSSNYTVIYFHTTKASTKSILMAKYSEYPSLEYSQEHDEWHSSLNFSTAES